MTDFISDLLLAAVAITMLILALEHHSLTKKVSALALLFTQGRTAMSKQEHTSLTLEEPKKSEFEDQFEHFYGLEKSGNKSVEVVKPAEKPVPEVATALVVVPQEKAKVDEPKKSKEEKAFSMEEFVSGA